MTILVLLLTRTQFRSKSIIKLQQLLRQLLQLSRIIYTVYNENYEKEKFVEIFVYERE